MKYVLLAFGLFFIYKLFKAWYVFRNVKEESEFYLEKVERGLKEYPDNPILFCVRGSIFQTRQNFLKANLDFNTALHMINNGAKVADREDLINKIEMNISYTEKPLSWTKNGPKDLSKSWFTYFLIERLGHRRVNF